MSATDFFDAEDLTTDRTAIDEKDEESEVSVLGMGDTVLCTILELMSFNNSKSFSGEIETFYFGRLVLWIWKPFMQNRGAKMAFCL